MKYMITLFFTFLSLVLKAPEQRCLYIERAEGIEYFDMNDLSLLLNKYQIKYPEIVKRQICLETGHLTSFVCKHYHNLCGMKYANRRKTTAIGVEKSYAVYSNYEKSVQDYKIWQDLYYHGEDYFTFLNRIGYSENSKYIETLKKINL